ncbi:hypothetical protein QBC38DRAFT_168325 [Podospora fimiseda]|uniref:Uncharacterized protein n=1 Tax=Podospora fimiseda TaxID=252190 RepID=A0AAN7GVU7_9PEZI|nr:hypothetical protein QBC38DRAFT_168325 [Podospora fimiseda]
MARLKSVPQHSTSADAAIRTNAEEIVMRKNSVVQNRVEDRYGQISLLRNALASEGGREVQALEENRKAWKESTKYREGVERFRDFKTNQHQPSPMTHIGTADPRLPILRYSATAPNSRMSRESQATSLPLASLVGVGSQRDHGETGGILTRAYSESTTVKIPFLDTETYSLVKMAADRVSDISEMHRQRNKRKTQDEKTELKRQKQGFPNLPARSKHPDSEPNLLASSSSALKEALAFLSYLVPGIKLDAPDLRTLQIDSRKSKRKRNPLAQYLLNAAKI